MNTSKSREPRIPNLRRIEILSLVAIVLALVLAALFGNHDPTIANLCR